LACREIAQEGGEIFAKNCQNCCQNWAQFWENSVSSKFHQNRITTPQTLKPCKSIASHSYLYFLYVFNIVLLRTLNVLTYIRGIYYCIRVHFKAITPEDLEEIKRNVMSEKSRFAKLLAMGAAQAAADGVNAQSQHTPCVASTAHVDVVHPVLINAPVPSKAKAASTVTVPMDTEDSSNILLYL